MKYLLLAFSVTFYSMLSMAEQYSIRSCMLLPITDSAKSSVGHKIYEDTEKYLKRSRWCDYKSSSEVIQVFSRYRDKLPQYLDDHNVIKTVADRLKVGTIIRIKVGYDANKMNLSLDVLGEDGKDIYFHEKVILNKIDILQANTAISNWLDLYETTLPYDGRILGVLGDQINFTFPRNKKVAIGQEFKVKRLVRKKRHPLLKKVVEWESEVIAKGKIINLSRGQGLGMIKVYTVDKKLQRGQWIRLEKINPKRVLDDKNFSKYEKQSFGRLGDLALSLILSSNTATTAAVTGNNKMNGLIYGFSAEVETWITRNYILLGEFSRRIGSLSKSSGNPNTSSIEQSMTTLKVAGGYKYLPMGFFYGPQVNVYGGYAKYSYKLDASAFDGFGENAIGGLMIGAGGSIPLRKRLRLYAHGEIIPFAQFTDTSAIFGGSQSLSSMVLEVGGKYLWSSTISVLGSFEVINNSARFGGVNSELSYTDTSAKLGASFSF